MMALVLQMIWMYLIDYNENHKDEYSFVESFHSFVQTIVGELMLSSSDH